MCDINTFMATVLPNEYSNLCRNLTVSPDKLIQMIKDLPSQYKIGVYDKKSLYPFVFKFLKNNKIEIKKYNDNHDLEIIKAYTFIINYSIENNFYDSDEYTFNGYTIKSYIENMLIDN
jgi:hypothetical protein